MDASNEKEPVNPIIPLVIGAAAGAAGAAIAYLLAADHKSENGSKLSETLSKGWEALKEKVPFIEDEINSFKEKIMATVASQLQPEAEPAQEAVKDID